MTAVPWRAALRFPAELGSGVLSLSVALTTAQTLVPLAGLLALMYWLDAVAAGLAGRTATDAALSAITFATLVAAAVAALGNALRSVAVVWNESVQRRLADHWLQRVQQHASQVDLLQFDEPQFHALLQRAGSEASQRPVRLLQDGLALWAAGVGLLAMAVVSARVEPWLPALVAAAAVPLAIGRRRHAERRARWQQAHVADQQELGVFSGVLAARATAKDVRLLALGPGFLRQIAAVRDRLRGSLQKIARAGARDELLAQCLAGGGLFAAYWVLARQALAGELGFGAMVLQAQVAQRTQNGVRDLLAAWSGLREHRLCLEPLCALLATVPRLERPDDAAPPPGFAPPRPMAIRVERLTFAYAGAARPALQDVDVAFAAGERWLVVGPNGSGKSTLLKLLARLYDPVHGAISCDGVPLASIAPRMHRRRLLAVFQDTALYEVSLRENLSFGCEQPVDDARLWQALARVGMAEVVRALPAGLATRCSRRHDQGVDWSAGQARRLVLARAFVRPVDMLLLDEPFAALDAEGVSMLTAALRELPRTTTLVLVEHRGEARALVDRVLSLRDGRVASLPA